MQTIIFKVSHQTQTRDVHYFLADTPAQMKRYAVFSFSLIILMWKNPEIGGSTMWVWVIACFGLVVNHYRRLYGKIYSVPITTSYTKKVHIFYFALVSTNIDRFL